MKSLKINNLINICVDSSLKSELCTAKTTILT